MFKLRTLRRGLSLIACGVSLSAPATAAESDVWPSIRAEVFGTRAIQDSAAVFDLYAPAQAADAALIPISIRFSPETAGRATKVTLIIDRNPSPIAAVIHFGTAYRNGPNIGERVISTRIRVDSFSQVRAVLETDDGKLHMAAKFVAGAGGCSALPSKDMDVALANLGTVKIKSVTSDVHDPMWREGVVMIRHPNFTGMQMNPKTGAFTPARFVDMLDINRGRQLLLRIEGGISISEDPNFRFSFAGQGEDKLTVSGSDSDSTKFSGEETASGS
ncbi:MAG: quinoprotein dehydrogenase-associated SoxYZ-like carrier [Hyphomicrobium sp.]